MKTIDSYGRTDDKDRLRSLFEFLTNPHAFYRVEINISDRIFSGFEKPTGCRHNLPEIQNPLCVIDIPGYVYLNYTQ